MAHEIDRRLRVLEAVRIAEAAPKVRSISSLSWGEAMAGLPCDKMYPPEIREWYAGVQRWIGDQRSGICELEK